MFNQRASILTTTIIVNTHQNTPDLPMLTYNGHQPYYHHNCGDELNFSTKTTPPLTASLTEDRDVQRCNCHHTKPTIFSLLVDQQSIFRALSCQLWPPCCQGFFASQSLAMQTLPRCILFAYTVLQLTCLSIPSSKYDLEFTVFKNQGQSLYLMFTTQLNSSCQLIQGLGLKKSSTLMVNTVQP